MFSTESPRRRSVAARGTLKRGTGTSLPLQPDYLEIQTRGGGLLIARETLPVYRDLIVTKSIEPLKVGVPGGIRTRVTAVKGTRGIVTD